MQACRMSKNPTFSPEKQADVCGDRLAASVSRALGRAPFRFSPSPPYVSGVGALNSVAQARLIFCCSESDGWISLKVGRRQSPPGNACDREGRLPLARRCGRVHRAKYMSAISRLPKY